MNNQDILKSQNKEKIKDTNFKYNFNLSFFSSLKETSNNSNSLNTNNFVKDKNTSNNSLVSEVPTFSLSLRNNYFNLYSNIFFKNFYIQNFIKKPISNFPFSYNSFYNPPLFPFCLKQKNIFYSPTYNNNINNKYMNSISLLNKKRIFDDSIISKNKEIKKEKKNLFSVRIKKKYVFTLKYIDIKMEEDEKLNKKKVGPRKHVEKEVNKYFCPHIGCNLFFNTKKLKNFHHFKMSSECQDDSINILKLIYQTKKLLINNMEKKEISNDKYSSLYENTMKDISLSDYIRLYTGFKLNDNL